MNLIGVTAGEAPHSRGSKDKTKIAAVTKTESEIIKEDLAVNRMNVLYASRREYIERMV